MPHAQRHFCCLLAIDTSSSAGPKPFTRNLLGKAGRKAMALPAMGMENNQKCCPSLCACSSQLQTESFSRHCLEWYFCVWCDGHQAMGRAEELGGVIPLSRMAISASFISVGHPTMHPRRSRTHHSSQLAPTATLPSQRARRQGGG